MQARPMVPNLRATLRHSVMEGGLYAAMVGFGEVYFVADAVRLGANPYEVVLQATLPLFVGSMGPLLALRILRSGRSRKAVVVAGALGQVFALCAILFSQLLGSASPSLLIALVCAYQV